MKVREVPKTRGRPRKGAERNEEILLKAALDAFAEHGFDKASLRSIAAAANVDVALISYRYGSKIELWEAVVERFAREAIASLATLQVDHAEVSSGNRLDAVIEQLIVLACQRPQFPQFIVRELVKGEGSEQVELLQNLLTEPLRRIVVPLVETVHGEVGNREFDANLAFFGAISAMGMTLATRKHIARFAPAIRNDDLLRQHLITVTRSILCP
ncbi:TetR family transcriptional regulator [Bradyrhizobium macuxiense]|uniref:TetR family transcriptional regulator n=1 Tax=Bradyrhizobium macuxiense TaxID=1755647 RepID=A0A560KXA8_9BRAD|nr:TetR/AcrR family transcriptional regulator [Bradyrhizobium macuxiense]TWB87749.1 TetR family transcriptional regulator [Bradyrhizobium macuxiense]